MKLLPRDDDAGAAPEPVHMSWDAAMAALASGAYDLSGEPPPHASAKDDDEVDKSAGKVEGRT